MQVKQVMTKDVQSCNPDTNLAAAAMTMWRYDCGVLPVVDGGGFVVGMITDRDICMAAAGDSRPASNIAVRQVLSPEIYGCMPEEDVGTALKTMREKRVRRLPVVNAEKLLCGILSIDDLVLRALELKRPDLPLDDVMKTIAAFCGHRAVPSSQEASCQSLTS